jgi:hypothetical protein
MEYGNPILIKGPFRVVPLLEETENQRQIVVGYAVLNAEGAKLCHELSFDEAKTYMEKLYDEENPNQIKSRQAVAKKKPSRR